MAGLFNTLNIAVKGLNAQQTSLHTTSHNISNINTEGFSRQRVELKADTSYTYVGVGQLGTGVKLEGVVRMVDDFVNDQIRKENSALNQYMAKDDIMSQIEKVFNEPSDTGLNFAMNEMFNSWQELSKNPESLNAQSIVAEKSKTFAETLNHMASQIHGLKDDTVSNIEKNALDINSLAERLSTVNDQIFNITVKGQSPNDLLDERDLIMKEMNGLAEMTAKYDKWGRVSLTLGEKELTAKDNPAKLSVVSGMESQSDGTVTLHIAVGGDISNIKDISLSVAEAENFKAGSAVFYDDSTSDSKPTLAKISSGVIGGNLEAINEIESRIEELDQFAQGTAKLINTVHNVGGTGVDFFAFKQNIDNPTGEQTALNFSVSSEVLADESKVATGDLITSPEGDGSRALAIANLRNTKINFKDIDNLTGNYDSATMKFEDAAGGVTMNGSYNNIVTKVGISTQQASNMVKNEEAVMAQLLNRRESVSGVSLDEEVTNLMKFQRGFEANSRVISTLSEMLDTLINRTGI
jgi:flagellar hook-associated protein 1 FlgK